MANNILFKTDLLKGPKGDRGDAGESYSVPINGILAFDGDLLPEGYEDTGAPDPISTLEQEVETLSDRVDSIIALPDGSTTADAELVDIRIGYDNATYNSAGAEVRGSDTKLQNQIDRVSVYLAKDYECISTLETGLGGYYDASGNLIELSGWRRFYIPVIPKATYVFTGAFTYNSNSYMCEFDIYGNFIQNHGKTSFKTVTVGETAAYIGFSVKTSGLISLSFVQQKYKNMNCIDVYKQFSGEIDCDNLGGNTLKVFNMGATLINGPSGFGDIQDGACWEIETLGPFTLSNNDTLMQQTISSVSKSPAKRTAIRDWLNGSWGPWAISRSIEADREKIIVDINGNGNYTKITDAMIYAYNSNNVDIYVRPGEYDMASELDIDNVGVGKRIGKGTRMFFDAGAVVLCDYEGGDAEVAQTFSPFNAGTGDFEIHNLTLKCKNVRYGIHDEMWQFTDPYYHLYDNCVIELDNRDNTQWETPNCIGGGLGVHGTIEVIGGRYKGLINGQPEAEISYHNIGQAVGQSKITIKDVYFTNATARFGYYGTSEDITECYVTGCSMPSAPFVRAESESATVVNMVLYDWNNNIRE